MLEERLTDDPYATHAAIHSLNQWIDEVWSFNYKDRIFATPVISLPIVEKAIEELNWAYERGARVVLVRPAPVPGFTHVAGSVPMSQPLPDSSDLALARL